MSKDNDITFASAAVSVAVIDERDGCARVLLVLRANAPAQGLYAFPGGRVEPGESLEAAALRELQEETGLIGANPVPLKSYDLQSRDAAGRLTSWFDLTVFSAELHEDSATDPVANDDAAAASWFDRAALPDLPMPDSVRDCLVILGFLDSAFAVTQGAMARPARPASDMDRRRS